MEERQVVELSKATWEKIDELSKKGNLLIENEKYEDALFCFLNALKLIPTPATEWPAGMWLYASIGDAYFLMDNYSEAYESFQFAVLSPDGLGNPFIHLRLGQCAFNLRNYNRAADELIRAYMGAGQEIFETEEDKYLEFLATRAILD